MNTPEYLKTLERAEDIAERTGYIINPDMERVRKVIGLMTMNFMETGKYFCPCKQSHPLDPENDVVCPCTEIHQEVEKDGNCFCRLFYS